MGGDLENGSENYWKNKCQYCDVFLLILSKALYLTTETAFTSFFALYIEDKYNGSVLFAMCLAAYGIVCFVIGSGILQTILNKYYSIDTTKDLRLKFLLLSIVCAASISILFYGYVIPSNLFQFKYIYTYWIYIIICNISSAFLVMSITMLIIQQMPKHIAGKIGGTKICAEYCIKGFGALIVSILWDYDENWLWYFCAIANGVVIIPIILFAIFNRCHIVK